MVALEELGNPGWVVCVQFDFERKAPQAVEPFARVGHLRSDQKHLLFDRLRVLYMLDVGVD